MMRNKKAQNITEPYTLILIVVVIGMFTTALFSFGQDLASNPDNKLNNESIQYIFDKSGFTPSNQINTSDTTDLFFSSDLNTSGNTKDFALEYEFYREQSSGIRSKLQDLWNIPSFFVSGLDLEESDWSTTIIIWNSMIWMMIFYAVYRIIRARIK